MNKTKIEYVDYTWNPLVGCKHACEYCFAEKMNKRFKWIDNWQKPVYFYKRLDEPYKLRKPARILVGSMTDLFGDWVNTGFIKQVRDITRLSPLHTFLFLTKNPKRYAEFEFPENCWLGTTVERTSRINRVDILRNLQTNNLKFVSFEPLLGDMAGLDFGDIDWGIIGGLTPYHKMENISKWIRGILDIGYILDIPIFMKENLRRYWDGEWRTELPKTRTGGK